MARAIIKFTRENLKKEYSNGRSCPIFTAMTEAGVPVMIVYPEAWVSEDHGSSSPHLFSKALQLASDTLVATSGYPQERARKLLGKRFLVRW